MPKAKKRQVGSKTKRRPGKATAPVKGTPPRGKAKEKAVARSTVAEGKARVAAHPAAPEARKPARSVTGPATRVEPEVLEPEEIVEAADVAAEPRGLQRADPLRAYMAEVQRHPLITREEEVALARKYRGSGDIDAAARLVSANLRLVVKLAHQYHRNPLTLLDLIQEGNIGLMQAVKKFDPDRGVKLSTYAAWWIRAYILRYIMDNWKMVKIGTTEAQRKLFFKLRQEQQRLTSQGIEATPKLLAERLHVTEQDVEEMDQRLGQDELSLDAPLGDDGKTTRAERLLPSSAEPGADDQLASDEVKRLFRDKLTTFADHLDGKEKFIFEKRLIADDPMTLQDIGTQFGVSRERARQIEAQLLGRIREHLRREIPDFDVVARPDR